MVAINLGHFLDIDKASDVQTAFKFYKFLNGSGLGYCSIAEFIFKFKVMDNLTRNDLSKVLWKLQENQQ